MDGGRSRNVIKCISEQQLSYQERSFRQPLIALREVGPFQMVGAIATTVVVGAMCGRKPNSMVLLGYWPPWGITVRGVGIDTRRRVP